MVFYLKKLGKKKYKVIRLPTYAIKVEFNKYAYRYKDHPAVRPAATRAVNTQTNVMIQYNAQYPKSLKKSYIFVEQ